MRCDEDGIAKRDPHRSAPIAGAVIIVVPGKAVRTAKPPTQHAVARACACGAKPAPGERRARALTEVGEKNATSKHQPPRRRRAPRCRAAAAPRNHARCTPQALRTL